MIAFPLPIYVISFTEPLRRILDDGLSIVDSNGNMLANSINLANELAKVVSYCGMSKEEKLKVCEVSFVKFYFSKVRACFYKEGIQAD
jgi:hypothetical protein